MIFTEPHRLESQTGLIFSPWLIIKPRNWDLNYLPGKRAKEPNFRRREPQHDRSENGIDPPTLGGRSCVGHLTRLKGDHAKRSVHLWRTNQSKTLFLFPDIPWSPSTHPHLVPVRGGLRRHYENELYSAVGTIQLSSLQHGGWQRKT